jgi:hypothetical protein
MTINLRSCYLAIVIFIALAFHFNTALHTIESIRNNHELIAKLEQVKGVYEDSSKSKQMGVENTVLITACNHGFLNHLYNFDCFMKRLKMKYLVFAMDKQAYDYLRTNTSINVYNMNQLGDSGGEVTALPQLFRSKQFNIITAKKKEAVHDVMLLGYDVLFSDTDVALIRDPFPYMIWKNVDYVHSLNAMCQV